MLSTLEIRWFNEGKIPDDMQGWFSCLEGSLSEQPARTDFYLQMNDNDGLGIKLREGRVEIKKRNHQFGLFKFNSGLEGIIENWEKWGFGMNEDSMNYENISDPKYWIAVRKQRLLRKYELAGHHIRPMPPESIINEAFNLELSSVVLFDRTFWSLNLEAYGGNNLNPEVFKRIGNFLFQDAPVVHVNTAISCGFPKWINKISNS